MAEYDSFGISFSLPGSIEAVASWLQEQVSDEFWVTIQQPGEKENRVQLHDKRLGFAGTSDLGEVRLDALSDTVTLVTISEPPAPEPRDVLAWAYPQILAEEMRDFIRGEAEELFVRAAGLSRLFFKDSTWEDEGWDESEEADDGDDENDLSDYLYALSTVIGAHVVLTSVPEEIIIRPRTYRKITAEDTWEKIAKDFYGDEKYTELLIEEMARHFIFVDDLKSDIYLPVVYLFKTSHPVYTPGDVQYATDVLTQYGAGFEQGEVLAPLMALFGISSDQVLNLLIHIYKTADSTMKQKAAVVEEWQSGLVEARRQKQAELISALKAAFSE